MKTILETKVKSRIKKTLAILCVAFAAAFAAAQEAPAFDGENAENAIVISVKEHKGAKDTVVLVNLAENAAAKFSVYTYKSGKGWTIFGNALLKSLYDQVEIESDSNLKKCEYVAVVPSAQKKYEYKTRVASSDLYVYFVPKAEEKSALLKKAKEVDVQAMKGLFKDKVRFVALDSKVSNAGLYVFASKGGDYEFIGAAYLKGINDTCNTRRCDGEVPLGTYTKFAIATDASSDFKTRAQSNDLYVFLVPGQQEVSSLVAKAKEVDTKGMGGLIKDKIRFVAVGANVSAASLYVFASKGGDYEFIGAAYLKSTGDTCYARRCDGEVPLGEYTKFAVAADRNFSFETEAKSNDLYIYVND